MTSRLVAPSPNYYNTKTVGLRASTYLTYISRSIWRVVAVAKWSRRLLYAKFYGNLIEEIVDFAWQINLKVDHSRTVLDSHNQELTIDELIEMHQEQYIEELSLHPVQELDRKTIEFNTLLLYGGRDENYD
ncbi:hypothetical protein TNCV_3276721 [Trichonephila clavipes]|nr:hypothetical protein TNCV_3276721 [Trichonephila clavipes]